MTLKIEFIPVSKEAELVVPCPKPAKNYLPQWYKDVLPATEPEFDLSKPGIVVNKNIKSCMPFFDGYTQGYIQETWSEIYIEYKKHDDGTHSLQYHSTSGPEIINHRDNNVFQKSDVFYDTEFTWAHQWVPKCPAGYSILYTSPLNHFNLPFRSLDAVVDSDMYYHEYSGKAPFYINKGFSGLIPVGTPMYQMIPIKREDWSSSTLEYDYNANYVRTHMIRKYFMRNYKRLFWQKKNFN